MTNYIPLPNTIHSCLVNRLPNSVWLASHSLSIGLLICCCRINPLLLWLLLLFITVILSLCCVVANLRYILIQYKVYRLTVFTNYITIYEYYHRINYSYYSLPSLVWARGGWMKQSEARGRLLLCMIGIGLLIDCVCHLFFCVTETKRNFRFWLCNMHFIS